ncbi:hypothetical protein J2Y38_004069 [Flavobacterium sp. 2755]|uniref:eCIS core domain-containing protein n=1 Tax=Flavobacterium sp. 2755 TaxID=2817765 RepID=UPI00285DF9AE|nr:DUF4157 domain-containing protein [Flavobacterium sp. 2755]MDR6763845.1 hypothetical protein [Flavobacterium sp. 2755]
MSAFNQRLKPNASESSPFNSRKGEDFFGVQAKLNVGKSNDKYEVEADTVANKIVSNSSKKSAEPFFSSSTVQKNQAPEVHKKENKENEIQEKPLAESITPVVQLQPIQKCNCEEENVQKKEGDEAEADTAVNSNFESQLNSSKGGGKALSNDTKTEMESGFGADFSNVRIHNDSNAVQMSQQIGAQAFANGNDIYFNEGKYNPNSQSGKHLLAHELTHTVQQGNKAKLQRQEVPPEPAPPPRVEHRISTMLSSLIEWEAAGLLSAPYLPYDVPTIPQIPVTQEEAASMASAAPALLAGLTAPSAAAATGTGTSGAAATGTTALETAAARWGSASVIEGGAALAEGGATVAAGAEATSVLTRIAMFSAEAAPPVAFFTILLWPTSTAPRWMDELNPITGGPYASPREYDWVNRLSPNQREYLDYLGRARRLTPRTSGDEETDPRTDIIPLPDPAPQPEEDDDRTGCKSREITRLGGHARHDAYATKVSGRSFDFNVWPGPPFSAINYDGQTNHTIVWEVKVGFGWFFNPAMISLRDLTLARFDAQKNFGVFVAQRCAFFHVWSIPDRHVAFLLNTRWGGYPPVLSIPE